MSSSPDEILNYIPDYCHYCGLKIDSSAIIKEVRQVIDLPRIKPIITEHRVFSKVCQCGHCTIGTFPDTVKAPVSYGDNVEALISYLSARQFVPINRVKEFLSQVCSLNLSQGTVINKIN